MPNYVYPIFHQPAHCDGETNNVKISSNNLLKGLFKPGTIFIPLEEHRDIYVINGENENRVKYGEVLFFFGDMPHGGVYYQPDGDQR